MTRGSAAASSGTLSSGELRAHNYVSDVLNYYVWLNFGSSQMMEGNHGLKVEAASTAQG